MKITRTILKHFPQAVPTDPDPEPTVAAVAESPADTAMITPATSATPISPAPASDLNLLSIEGTRDLLLALDTERPRAESEIAQASAAVSAALGRRDLATGQRAIDQENQLRARLAEIDSLRQRAQESLWAKMAPALEDWRAESQRITDRWRAEQGSKIERVESLLAELGHLAAELAALPAQREREKRAIWQKYTAITERCSPFGPRTPDVDFGVPGLDLAGVGRRLAEAESQLARLAR